ncbi:MipA/OmpV family protein [Sulfitobacter sp. BDSS02]|nr:MipA/OmpV family protein [Sulfitobacter sp. BDSS02]MBR9851856.1 MipA/OmpV family protein [Paracoccaceae bacterium]
MSTSSNRRKACATCTVIGTLALALAATLCLTKAAHAEGNGIDVPGFPQFFALGIGAGPRYAGADDNTWAIAPAGRLNFGERYVSLEANYLSINLLDHPNWRIGPAGILRFGRSDAESGLSDISMSLDLGGFVAFETSADDPRNRWRLAGGILQDVTGVHDGHVADASIRRWLPAGRYGALGLGLAASWGSGQYMNTYFGVDAADAALTGIGEFLPGAGWRDIRASIYFVQPVSTEWAVGAGLLYSRLIDDAVSSPATESEGQLFFGIGVARAW